MNNPAILVGLKLSTAFKWGFGFYLGLMCAEALLQMAIKLALYFYSPAAQLPL